MHDLRYALIQARGLICGPGTHRKDFLRVRCYCEFEGHGAASENFEECWEIELPLIPYHWYSLTGWRKGTSPRGMWFRRHSFEDCKRAALEFLGWWGQQHAEREAAALKTLDGGGNA